MSESALALRLPLGDGVAGRVAQTGEVVRLDDVRQAEDYRVVTENVQSELCVPIRSGDQVIGVINAESRLPAAFTDADERLLVTAAGQLATGIERARLFAALRESEARFRAVAESAAEAIVTWTADGHIVALNPAAGRLFRLGPFGAVGKSLESLIAPIHRRVTRRYLRQMTSERPRPRTEALRIRGLRADGTEFPLEVSVARWTAGGQLYLTGIGRDISRQVAAEAALARRADELQQVADLSAALRQISITGDMVPKIAYHTAKALDAIGASVLLANDDGGLTLRAVYPEMPEVVGLNLPPGEGLTAKVLRTGEPLVAQPLAESEDAIVPPPLADKAAETDSVVAVPLKTRDRCVGVMHVALEGAAGGSHLRLLSALAEVAGNALNRAQAFETLEDRVLQRTRDLYEANARLLELDRLKSKFVSDVSHELRTPVSNLRLYLHLMEKGDPGKRDQYLQVLNNQTTRLANLIEDILDLGRLDLTADEHHHQPTDLNDVVDAVRRESEARAKEKGLALRCILGDDLPMVRGDSNQLLQLAANLVTNALNYTPAGSVSLETRANSGGVILRVTDTGIGIGADDMPHLFDRFYRGTAVSQLDTPGTGLGLAIVQEIVELHGGRITVQSEVGEGTNFEIWLPRWGEPRDDKGPGRNAKPQPNAQRDAKPQPNG